MLDLSAARMKTSVVESLIAVALTLVACERDECSAASHEVHPGEVFDVVAYGTDFSTFCAAGLETSREHAQWVAAAWGEPPNRFDYWLFQSREHDCWPCSPGVLGCAWPTHLAATELPHRHEIAHSVRGLPCPALLEEGWAELYGDPFRNADVVGDLREAADSARSGVLDFEFYPLAAKFVAFLLETRNLGGLKELCKQDISDSESLNSALMTVFGQSLDEISAEFDDYPDWRLSQMRQDQACEGIDSIGVPGSWAMSLECDHPEVEGREGGPLIAHQLVDLPQAGNYTFRFDAAVNFYVELELRSCTREGMASIFYNTYAVLGYGTPKDLLVLDLPAGLHVFRLKLYDAVQPLSLQMTVEPSL
jgi:hypothetical protein